MGTLTSALATAVTDEYIHLQQPIHELYLRADAQCMHIFDLDAGDRIQFDLPEQQSIDLLIFNTEQQLKPELLQALQAESHLVANGARATHAQLNQASASSQRLKQQLAQHAIQPDWLEQALTLHSPGKNIFQASAAIQVIVLNTGLDMNVQQQYCIDEVPVTLFKAQPVHYYLPQPLAKPVQEILIPRASARTYSVKAGQWIQIIDLSGKQCSDFLAFDAQALAQGQELGLDAMATRTILGHATRLRAAL
ncbi:DUF1989 domain-containing protein [Acinetobacter baumannii]|nr:DUF1989 domain-containing protein [Acinetobacter baumannii]